MRWFKFEDFTFPIPDEQMQDLNWKLRYGGGLSETERLCAASVLSAYSALVCGTQAKAISVLRELKGAVHGKDDDTRC